MTLIIGSILVLAGSVATYLASSNQQVTKRKLPSPLLKWCGLGGILAGLVALLQWSGPATSFFITMTLTMLIWTGLPIIAAWITAERGEER
ncbi:hypothetical protein [Alteraurantiacibacter aquimixticola]|uniref:DUF3325 domain-containing protein n=1 Tax=Alteraurantiacibacter aquimixticola TaxID=2489173 RepID=A0A4T3F5A1_9SPHN|nr:hypothetical protein [Alteraurantiacibacter aquimixticola]TIX51659.1 hypothetical protein E5222_04200 [Alteraurantiacibacter aquimixticola]